MVAASPHFETSLRYPRKEGPFVQCISSVSLERFAFFSVVADVTGYAGIDIRHHHQRDGLLAPLPGISNT